MLKYSLSLALACIVAVFAYAQASKFDIKYQKETVLVDGKPFCLLKTSETLPTSYSIQSLDGTELVSLKPVYIKVETGKREGYFLVTFIETGQSLERETAPSFGRVFLQELIETGTLTLAGIDVEKERGFIRKSNLRLSEAIKGKIKAN
jgi:hypothetical protein